MFNKQALKTHLAVWGFYVFFFFFFEKLKKLMFGSSGQCIR